LIEFEVVAVTGSTNADLRKRQDAPHGTALLADRQTAGKGRLGRTWESPAGANIHLSVVLRPSLPISRVPMLCLSTAIAVAEVCGEMYTIKWPNDVLAPDGRKVAGILAEMETVEGGLDRVIMGVGINVSAAPPLPTAVSLLEVDGLVRDRDSLARRLVERILAGSARVVADPEGVLQSWRSRSSTIGARVRIGEIAGVATGIDADGALWVLDDSGSRHRILAGDVQMIG
jgi:BirA family biotin operon repressor/biotin-[acetyl-CoA-carboxylase] ligase